MVLAFDLAYQGFFVAEGFSPVQFVVVRVGRPLLAVGICKLETPFLHALYNKQIHFQFCTAIFCDIKIF